MAKRKNNKRVRSKRVRSKRIRSKRVQRTKKTRINRRSKKTKRTQVNRRIKRNRRMKGGMEGEELFGIDLSLQRSLDLLPPLEDDIELAGSLPPPAEEQVRVYMSINGIEVRIGLSATFGQFKRRLIDAGFLSEGQDIFFVEKPESQMIEFNRVEYGNLDPMKTYIVFKTGGSKKKNKKNKKGKRKHMKPKASIGKSGSKKSGGGGVWTSQEKALLSEIEE